LPKENDLEGPQDMGGKHGGQAGMPKPENRSGAQRGIEQKDHERVGKAHNVGMRERRHFKQPNHPRDQDLLGEAERLRKEARGTPPGIERERLIRRAQRAETAANMVEWVKSSGLKAPT